MKTTRIGYARCSTDKQDLATQHAALTDLDVASDRIYADHGLTDRNGPVWIKPDHLPYSGACSGDDTGLTIKS